MILGVFSDLGVYGGVPVVIPDTVPQGTWTIGTITKGQTTASLMPTYSLTDADSYEYTINGSAWIAFTGTISLAELDPDALQGGAVRAVNSIGNGASESFSFTTERVPVPPVLDTSIPDLSLSESESVSINLNSYFSGATSYTVTGFPAGSGLSFSGSRLTGTTSANDIAASPFTLIAEAFSADGSITDAFAVTVLGDAPVIAFSAPLTTTDTSPIVSGTAGTATSITLTVNGQTYTPAVTSGQWSQQLPTLAPNSYPMTLNGEDAEGVPAEEVQATLLIIEAVVNADVAASSFRFTFRFTF